MHKELTDHLDDSKSHFGNVANEIQIIRSNYMTEVGECRRSSDGLDQRLSKLEGVCGRFDSFSDSLERIREGLNRHVSGLWSCVNGLNVTVKTHGDQIDTIQNFHLENVHSGMRRLNSSVTELAKDFYSFIQQDFMGKSWRRSCQVLCFWTRNIIHLKVGEVGGRKKKKIEHCKYPDCHQRSSPLEGLVKACKV